MAKRSNPVPHIEALQERGSSRMRKVPSIMQMEALECGAACLAMVLASWGKWVPLEQVRVACGVSRDGSNAFNILRAARSFGLEAKAYRWEPETFVQKAAFPCIVHWDFNHFVVVRGVKNGKVYLVDPADGPLTVSMERFDQSFTGIAMLFAPGDSFVADGKKKGIGPFVKNRLAGTVGITIVAIVLSVLSSLLAMTGPLFTDAMLTTVLGASDPRYIVALLFLMLPAAVLALLVGVITARHKIQVGNKLNAAASSSFIWHVLHLPMEFFSQRSSADIEQRMGLNAGITESLVNTLAPLALCVISAVVYLALMLSYSVVLTVVGVASVLLNIAMARLASRKRVDLTKTLMRDLAMVQSSTTTGVQMIETVKAAGAEEGYFARWAGYQANAANARTRIQRETLFVSTLPSVVGSLANILIMIAGVTLVLGGEFAVGSILAFQGVLSQFMGPSTQLISAGQTIAEMRTNMERIDDVMDYPEQQSFAPYGDSEDVQDDLCKLEGNIVFEDVTFAYGPLDDPLIEDFSLELHPGEQVAIVGPSGCGKSTVAKLAMGLYAPRSGRITFDGRPLSQIPSDIFFSSVAMVDQDVMLFADTVANNIRMWDATISDESMYRAAMDAQIHNQIMARPGAYMGILRENGSDLSGGERQRLEIARALAQDPTVIVLDEATSALDAQTERDVVQALRDRGATTLVIAHRLATVRQADRIVVLDRGRIVEQGTHEELISLDGVYAALQKEE